jgi:hypothetical protein
MVGNKIELDNECEFPTCDYCHNLEDCPYNHKWKTCGADMFQEEFNFFEIIKCEDWIGLFKWNDYIKENPLDSMIEMFEDEMACEDELFDTERLTSEIQAKIDNAIKQCNTNEEIIETVEYWFKYHMIPYEYSVYHYELVKNNGL